MSPDTIEHNPLFMEQPSSTIPSWLLRVLTSNLVVNLFTDYISLPCYVVARENLNRWYTLSLPMHESSPLQFEMYFGKKEARTKYNNGCLELAAQTQKGVLAQHMGLWDYFVPVIKDGQCVAYLFPGSFLRGVPTLKMVNQQFMEMAGKAPALSDPIFNDYVRTLLKTPLVDEEALPDFKKIMEILAQMIADEMLTSDQLEQIETIKSKILSKSLTNRMWNYVKVKRNRLSWGAWQGTELLPLDREEFNLKRHPNTVLAVTVSREGKDATHEVKAMLEAAQMQWECFQFVRQFAETVSGPMDDQGAFFLTSLDPQKSAAQTRIQVQEMAISIETHLREKFNSSVYVGVSRLDHAAEELPEAFRESVLALHLGLHHQKNLVFYQDQYSEEPHQNEFSVLEWSSKVVDACIRAEEKEIRIMREEYVREVLRISTKKPDVLKVYFLQLLHQLLDTVRKRALVSESQFETLSQELSEKYSRALTTSELLSLFRTHLEFFTSLFLSPLRGERSFRLDRAKDYIIQNFQRELSLMEVASRTGFSVSRFSRCFKEAFGVGFSRYLLNLRCDHAKRLLETTRLSIGTIAQDCGFQSTSYFIHQFKRHMGTTPQIYRENKRNSF